MPEVADVFRSYGSAYQERFSADFLPSHRRAMEDIIHCRTEALGGHLWPCDHCSQEHYAYHSCRNRSCPKCHHHDTEVWLAARRQELLPVPDFHVVLTLPQELHELVRRHQKDLYDMLPRAAAQALITLAMDPHDGGGLMGVLCILHTWRTSYLVPVHALAKLFRGLFLDLVRQERPDLIIPEVVWTKGWVVYCKPAVQGTEKVLHYLGRYVHRIALTNPRLLSIDNGQVCFRYQDSQASVGKP